MTGGKRIADGRQDLPRAHMRADRFLALMESAGSLSDNLRESYFSHKPIISGAFSGGSFVLATCAHKASGLDAVLYAVFEASSWLVLATADTKAGAIGDARELLGRMDPLAFRLFVARRIAGREARAAEEAEAILVERDAARIPRRRQTVFDKSGGRCFYCRTPLNLRGKWHIEHKMPKALMGSDGIGNLVASCVRCNLRKSDQTDVEFRARESQDTAPGELGE